MFASISDESEVEGGESETEIGATYNVSSDVHYTNNKMNRYVCRLAAMLQQSGKCLLFSSVHGIAGFLVDELQI